MKEKIFDYIQRNPGCDCVDILFNREKIQGMRDLMNLCIEGRVITKHIRGSQYGYFVNYNHGKGNKKTTRRIEKTKQGSK